MTSCQTWSTASHFRHPWFDKTIPKRKHPESVSQQGEEEDSLPPQKRLRSSPLERGFAHLSINSSGSSSRSSSPPNASVGNVAFSDLHEEEPMDTDESYQTPLIPITSAAPHPVAIDEPSVPEVNMKTSSWYEAEPDRIVITDLDSYSREDEEEEEDFGKQEETISVNSALLERIKSQARDNTRTQTTSGPPSTQQALVLFKPLPLPASPETPPPAEKTVETAPTATLDENAMDIEL